MIRTWLPWQQVGKKLMKKIATINFTAVNSKIKKRRWGIHHLQEMGNVNPSMGLTKTINQILQMAK